VYSSKTVKNYYMNKKEPKEIFYKTLIACVAIVGFGMYLSIRGSKEKTEFPQVTGKIDYYHRFIHIVDSPIMFDVFVGKETGDFSPQFEQLDKLAIGDEIIVYHAGKTPLQRNSDVRFNKTVQFVDKDGVAYFIRGSKDKYGGYLFIGLGGLLAILILILKKFGKIK